MESGNTSSANISIVANSARRRAVGTKFACITGRVITIFTLRRYHKAINIDYAQNACAFYGVRNGLRAGVADL